jgi:Domain of unknown function (DUF4434)
MRIFFFLALVGCQPRAPVAEATAALGDPPLGGTFLVLSDLQSISLCQSDFDAYMAQLEGLGMSTVIIQSSMHKLPGMNCAPGHCCALDGFGWNRNMDPLDPGSNWGPLMQAAAAHHISVYVGLVDSDWQCWEFWKMGAGDLGPAVVAKTQEVAQQIRDRLLMDAVSYPYFKGWYIPDEAVHCDPAFIEYYKQVHDAIRSVDGDPNHKILVSPYLKGAQGTITPNALAVQALAFLEQTHVDVEVWQDSVGAYSSAGAINLDPNLPESTVEDWFTALRDTLGTEHLWADNELFTYGMVGTLFDLNGRSASGMRLNRQLWETRPGIAGMRVSWLEQNLMGSFLTADTEPARLMSEYRALYGLGGAYLSSGAPYFWSTQPVAPWLDGAGKLTDTWTGNPRHFDDHRWVGVIGDADFAVDVRTPTGGAQRVDWVGVDLLREPAAAIEMPFAMDIYCGPDRVNFTLVSSELRQHGLNSGDREYLFANQHALGVNCAFVRVHLYNSPADWTFLSEVEITRDGP